MVFTVDAQELRRRWSDKTNACFSPSERVGDEYRIPAESYERELDFQGCRAIIFANGSPGSKLGDIPGEDVILLTKGTGHMTLPANVQVQVVAGFVKCEPAYGSSGAGSAVGVGIRAPPPSRVGTMYNEDERSQAGSASLTRGRNGSVVSSGGSGYSRQMPSPPRDGFSFKRSSTMGSGSSVGSYVSAQDVPLPRSVVSGAGGRGYDDDNCSIAPSESISSVGSRSGGRAGFSRSSTFHQ